MALGMLEHFRAALASVDGPDSVHLQIEAIKLAFADAGAMWRTSTTWWRAKPAALLDRGYLKSRARLIDPKRAQEFGPARRQKAAPCTSPRPTPRDDGVVHQSNYMGFGSGVVVDGISLQNRAATFVLQPGIRTGRPEEASLPDDHSRLRHAPRASR